MFQAIETRWLAPTNSRGSRIVATTEGGSRLTVAWDYALGVEGNHKAAAEALRTKMDWIGPRYGQLVGGATKAGYAFVFVAGQDPLA